MESVSQKPCSKCLVVKDLTEYYTRENGKARNECKSCWIKKTSSRNKEIKEDRRVYLRDWYKRNIEKEQQRSRNWRQNNKEKRKEVVRQYALSNKEKVLQNTRNRRAKIKGNKGRIYAEDWIALKEKYGNKCLKCGTKNKIEMDHVIPIALGGLHVIENVQPLCRNCNAQKSTSIIDYR